MDTRTIFLVESSLLLFLGLILLLMYHSHRRSARDMSIHWYLASNLCGAVGLVLLAERGHIPLFLTVLAGNFLVLIMGALLHHAVAIATEQRSRSVAGLLFALSLATILNFAYYTYWQPDIILRMEEASLVMALSVGVTAHLLLTSKLRSIRPAAQVMGVLLLLFSLGNVVRAISVFGFRLPDFWFLWFGACIISGITLCLLWIDSLKLRAELERLATTDSLTGLYNRRAIETLARRELARSARSNLPISVLMIDMDRFKQLNDSHGHAAGDQALCAVARALERCVRSVDLVARLGGDEFLVVLPNADVDIAEVVAQRIQRSIQKIRVGAPDNIEATIALSMGIVSVPARGITFDELLRQGDVNLYLSKSNASPRQKNHLALAARPSPIDFPWPSA
jgi:diguanylate cyclase (GGDEF)-like protein